MWLMRNLGGRRVCTWRRWAARRVWPASCSSGQCRVICVIRMERKERSHYISNQFLDWERQSVSSLVPQPTTQDEERGFAKIETQRLWKRLFFYHKNTQKSFSSGYMKPIILSLTRERASKREIIHRERTNLKFIQKTPKSKLLLSAECCLNTVERARLVLLCLMYILYHSM